MLCNCVRRCSLVACTRKQHARCMHVHAPCADRTLLSRGCLLAHSALSPAALLHWWVCPNCPHLLPSHLLTKGSCSCTSCDSTRPLTGPHSRLFTQVQAGFHHSRSGRLISWRSSVTTSSATEVAAQLGRTQQPVWTHGQAHNKQQATPTAAVASQVCSKRSWDEEYSITLLFLKDREL